MQQQGIYIGPTVIDCNGTPISVTTRCGFDYEDEPIPGETIGECRSRHKEKVAEIEADCQ